MDFLKKYWQLLTIPKLQYAVIHLQAMYAMLESRVFAIENFLDEEVIPPTMELPAIKSEFYLPRPKNHSLYLPRPKKRGKSYNEYKIHTKAY